MNGWERQYAGFLDGEIRAGRVVSYWFDVIKLRLADKTFYTPDFTVMMADDTIEIHEVKGHWEDDARVKIKVAADKFPFKFVAVTKERGEWKYEHI